MPKVYCAAIDCEFNGEDGKCHAKTISLSSNSIMTLWEGRQEFNKCKTYQESKEFIEMRERIKPLLEKMKEYGSKDNH